MKLKLFRLAAAFMLAGTLTAAAQESPEKQSAPEAKQAPSSDGEKSPPSGSAREDRGSAKQERGAMKEADQGARGDAKNADRSRKAETGKQDRRGNDDPTGRADERQADKADKPDKGADKNDKGGAKKADTNTSPDRAADQPKQSADDRKAGEGNRNADDRKSGDAKQNADADKSRTEGSGKNAQLAGDKRDRVQSSLRADLKLKRETKVDIDIRIGNRAHRGWAFAPVPTAVIEIVPEYRGYVVAYVEDEYVICEPDTYEIVAVLPAGGGGFDSTGTGSGESGHAGKCTSDLTLTRDEEDNIFGSVQLRNEAKISGGVTVGFTVPSDVELLAFPASILEHNSKLNACRYFVIDDQVAVVDPDEDKVILLIEKN